MRKRFPIRTVSLAAASLLLAACAATAPSGEKTLYLRSNKVVFTRHEPDLKVSDVTTYAKQRPGGFEILRRRMLVFNPDLVEPSVQSIRDHLDYLGFYDSDVQAEVRQRNDLVTVQYTVTPGRRYRISEVTYDLPQGSLFEADFLDDEPNVTIRPGSYLSEADLEAETARSAAYMRTKGYYGFTKDFYTFEADTLSGPEDVKLEMRVRDYARTDSPSNARPHEVYRIGRVTLSHAKDLPLRSDLLKDLITFRPGDLYNETEINTTYSRLSALRVFSTVAIELSRADSNRVDCAIDLTQSQLQGFKLDLEASSNSSGLIGISPQLSYYHKNIFHGGEWLNLSFLGNLQFRPKDPDRHSEEYGVNASISFPRFLGLPYSAFSGPNIPRTEINASYNYQSRPEYTRHIFSTSYGYSGKYRDRFTYQVYPLEVNYVRLTDIDPDFTVTLARNPYLRYAYQDHLDAGIGANFLYSSSPEIIPKETYHYIRTILDLSGNALSLLNGILPKNYNGQHTLFKTPYSQFVRAEVSVGQTWRFGAEGKYALATRFLVGAGYAYGNSTVMPFENQFYSGGANSLRGWQARAIGPGLSPLDPNFRIPSQVGDFKLEANLEYRFPLIGTVLEGALFADTGNIWSFKSDVPEYRMTKEFYKAIALNWGLGARVNLGFIVLRLDAGFKIHDPSQDEELRWFGPERWLSRNGFAIHFGVGYPF